MKDPKTELQEYVQSQFKILPKYKITQQIGPAHQPEITVECKVKKFTVVATASNRKAAENNCAQTMLQKLKNG
jgi:ribonuclease-3